MVSFPPCKINLGLRILRKRPDGYHDLETCFYPIPWTDILEVVRADTFAFTCSGNAIPGPLEANLSVKAYELIRNEFNIEPVRIHLHKIIPIQAGLGGGSSDAAHTLRLLNQVFHLDLSTEQLRRYAAKLGSDCAFFIEDVPMLGTGRGEILEHTTFRMGGKFVVVVKPEVNVSTADAFARVSPQSGGVHLTTTISEDMKSWRVLMRNDFEDSVFQKYPAIEVIKEKLYAHGATYASMSGSGAAVFAIFEAAVALDGLFEAESVWSGMVK